MTGSHRTMKRIGWIGLALLAATMGGTVALSRYGMPWQGSAAGADRTQAAEAVTSLRRAVAALGRIEPHSKVIDLGASTPGLVEELLVEEGEFVTKGKTLGYLDSYEERIAERDEQAARLEEARAMLDAEVSLGEARIAAAQIRLRQVQEVYPLRIEAQRARIGLLTADLENNRDILSQRLTLQRRDVGSRRTVADQRTLVRKNEEELEMAQADLGRLQAEQRMEVLAASAELRLERAALARARIAVGVASLEKDVALAEARVARATIRAPMDGQILKIIMQPGERVSDAPILQIGDPRTMHVVAEVYETDVGLVRLGQSATIASPSLPRDMTGRVVQIGRLIFKNDVLDVDPAADADARVVEVRIELDNGELVQDLTNMIVDVVIDLEGGDAVANVPPSATP
jgi:HlyD family secretion protein